MQKEGRCLVLRRQEVCLCLQGMKVDPYSLFIHRVQQAN
jgi:hypothetical protein